MQCNTFVNTACFMAAFTLSSQKAFIIWSMLAGIIMSSNTSSACLQVENGKALIPLLLTYS